MRRYVLTVAGTDTPTFGPLSIQTVHFWPVTRESVQVSATGRLTATKDELGRSRAKYDSVTRYSAC